MMIKIKQLIHKWKWHQKILYSIGMILILLMILDVIELTALYLPQDLSCVEISWRMHGSEKFNPPIQIRTEFIGYQQRRIENLETVPMSFTATHMSIFPWHKGTNPCFYHVLINRKTGKVFFWRKYLTFFWGMYGVNFHEIKTKSFQDKLFRKSLELLKGLDELNESYEKTKNETH